MKSKLLDGSFTWCQAGVIVAGCRMSVEKQVEKHARYLARLTEEGALDRYRRAVGDGEAEVIQNAAKGLWEASMQQRSFALDETKLLKATAAAHHALQTSWCCPV